MVSVWRLFLFGAAFNMLPLEASFAQEGASNWASEARSHIAKKQRYPKKALRAGLQGTVVVAITVTNSGDIAGFYIKKSSNHAILDKEVVTLLARAAPLPPLPEGLASEQLVIPLTYRFTDQRPAKANQNRKNARATDTPSNLMAWIKVVSRRISRQQSYPKHLRKKGIEGNITVQLAVDSSGNITSQRVSKSSGNEILDMEALNLAQKISPLPPLPEGRQKYRFSIPLKYELQ
jgi:TonB family protein